MDKQDLIAFLLDFYFFETNTRSAQKGELLVKAAVTEVHEKRCIFVI